MVLLEALLAPAFLFGGRLRHGARRPTDRARRRLRRWPLPHRGQGGLGPHPPGAGAGAGAGVGLTAPAPAAATATTATAAAATAAATAAAAATATTAAAAAGSPPRRRLRGRRLREAGGARRRRVHRRLRLGSGRSSPFQTSGQAREEDAENAYRYTDTLRANSQVGGCGKCGPLHGYTTSEQPG